MITPVGHRVLVEPDKIEETSAGGIVLVQDEKLEQAGQIFGTLVGIGDQAWLAFRQMYDGKEVNGRPWAKVGDRVGYARYAGKSVKDPETGTDFLILIDEDIVCIVEESSKEDK